MANIGDKIQLKNQEVEVVGCDKCGAAMVNFDKDQLAVGDLVALKKVGVVVSNPDTEEKICVNCEFEESHPIRDFFSGLGAGLADSALSNDDDDSSFFGGGGSSFGGFSGGGFAGGGASASF